MAISPARIRLNPQQLQRAHDLAEATLARYRDHAGHYRNTANSHTVGRIGEIGTAALLATRLPVQTAFDDPTRDADADLHCRGLRLEVKTWTDRYWPDWGRCVAVTQLPALKRKADAVIWASTDNTTVTVWGWNTVDDIAATPPTWTGPAARQIHNHQIPADTVRDIRDLRDLLLDR